MQRPVVSFTANSDKIGGGGGLAGPAGLAGSYFTMQVFLYMFDCCTKILSNPDLQSVRTLSVGSPTLRKPLLAYPCS